MENNFKVSLKGPAAPPHQGETATIVFDVSATVSEGRTANYDGYNIVHLPTDMFAYRNTSGRKFTVGAKLVSRTRDEARVNARALNLIRRWILPDFGASGATPPILYFSAYKNHNIKDLSTILRTYGWSFDDATDYIFDVTDPEFEPMPIIGALSFEVDEVYSAAEITAKAWDIKVNPLPSVDVQVGNQVGVGSSMYYGYKGGPRYKWPGAASGLFGIPGLPSVGALLNAVTDPLNKLAGAAFAGASGALSDVTKGLPNPFTSGPGAGGANPTTGTSIQQAGAPVETRDFSRTALPGDSFT